MYQAATASRHACFGAPITFACIAFLADPAVRRIPGDFKISVSEERVSYAIWDDLVFGQWLTFAGLWNIDPVVFAQIAGHIFGKFFVKNTMLGCSFQTLVIFFVVSSVALFADVFAIIKLLGKTIFDCIWLVCADSAVVVVFPEFVFGGLYFHHVVLAVLADRRIIWVATIASLGVFSTAHRGEASERCSNQTQTQEAGKGSEIRRST